MKTSDAKAYIAELHKQGAVRFDPAKGLLLTEKAAGVELLKLAELSVDQVSKLGEEFDPLFDTRKRITALTAKGVSLEALESLIAELKAAKGTPTNAEGNNLQTVLPGTGEDTPPDGGSSDLPDNSVKGLAPTEPEKESGSDGANGDIRQTNGRNNRRQTQATGGSDNGG